MESIQIHLLGKDHYYLKIVNLIMDENKYSILGVDPGTNILGFAILGVEGEELSVEDYGVIKLKRSDNHQNKLKEIYLQLQEIIEKHGPKEMAIEAPFFGKNVQSMLKLGRAQGVAIAAAITMGLDISEYSPKKIKQVVTGNGNASKEQVAAFLSQQLNVVLDHKYLDATDGLATALCHYYQKKNRFSSSSSYSGWKGYLSDNPDKVL